MHARNILTTRTMVSLALVMALGMTGLACSNDESSTPQDKSSTTTGTPQDKSSTTTGDASASTAPTGTVPPLTGAEICTRLDAARAAEASGLPITSAEAPQAERDTCAYSSTSDTSYIQIQGDFAYGWIDENGDNRDGTPNQAFDGKIAGQARDFPDQTQVSIDVKGGRATRIDPGPGYLGENRGGAIVLVGERIFWISVTSSTAGTGQIESALHGLAQAVIDTANG